jgi:hypothetical protein
LVEISNGGLGWARHLRGAAARLYELAIAYAMGNEEKRCLGSSL